MKFKTEAGTVVGKINDLFQSKITLSPRSKTQVKRVGDLMFEHWVQPDALGKRSDLSQSKIILSPRFKTRVKRVGELMFEH